MKTKWLKTGDADVGEHFDVLFTGGIGSCVVICLWDRITKIGGMAHMPLAHSNDSISESFRSLGMSPDIAVPYLLDKMISMGATHKNIVVKIAGGGNMFASISTDNNFMNDVGGNIVRKTVEVVESKKLFITKRAVGGHFGRSVEFTLETGAMKVNQTNGVVENL